MGLLKGIVSEVSCKEFINGGYKGETSCGLGNFCMGCREGFCKGILNGGFVWGF